jgi:hypothetical protein
MQWCDGEQFQNIQTWVDNENSLSNQVCLKLMKIMYRKIWIIDHGINQYDVKGHLFDASILLGIK